MKNFIIFHLKNHTNNSCIESVGNFYNLPSFKFLNASLRSNSGFIKRSLINPWILTSPTFVIISKPYAEISKISGLYQPRSCLF